MHPEDASTHLLALCAPHLVRTQRPWMVALSGLPGSGKSTLAKATVARAIGQGWPALALSLDDFYLPRRARWQLAARIHPLLATRGVPGTHDLALLHHVLARLPRASAARPVRVPRFDKGRDTRRPPSRWPGVTQPPRLLIVEGWFLGVQPQADRALARPVNTLEREEDMTGSWRRRANEHLCDYLPLWQRADLRVLLRVPHWAFVGRRREKAERALRQQHAPQAMDTAQLARFLQHYERIGRHALAHPPARVDWRIDAADDNR